METLGESEGRSSLLASCESGTCVKTYSVNRDFPSRLSKHAVVGEVRPICPVLSVMMTPLIKMTASLEPIKYMHFQLVSATKIL
jgi:hypothetical protein